MGLDSSDMNNFCPVSNLSFIFKVVERVVTIALVPGGKRPTFIQQTVKYQQSLTHTLSLDEIRHRQLPSFCIRNRHQFF